MRRRVERQLDGHRFVGILDLEERRRVELRLGAIAALLDEALAERGASHAGDCGQFDGHGCDCGLRSLMKARLLAGKQL